MRSFHPTTTTNYGDEQKQMSSIASDTSSRKIIGITTTGVLGREYICEYICVTALEYTIVERKYHDNQSYRISPYKQAST